MGKKFISYNGTIVGNGGLTLLSTETDTPTPPSEFTNCKSLTFDGVDDFVDIGNPSNLNSITSISISAWFKTTDAVGGLVIVGSDSNTQGRRYLLRTHNSSGIKLRFFSFSSNGSFNDIIGTTNINDGQWHHVLAINNGTNLKIYVDGILDNSNTDGNLINTTFATPDINIGRKSYSGVEGYFDGNIDEVAIWSSDQSANASVIYNSGIPTDLSTYNPLGWWRCGDGDTYPTLTDNGSGGNDGTMTNMSSDNIVYDVPLFNTRSILFDGTDDFVTILQNSTVGRTQNISYSVWVNLESLTNRQYIVGNWSSSNNGTGLSLETIGGNALVFQIGDGTNDSFFNSRVSNFSTLVSINTWSHILATWDGTDAKIYINGNLENTWSPTTPYTITNWSSFWIGRRSSNGSDTVNGKLDEIALFDSGVSIGDVWDGSGKPFDISSSNPSSWWRMGDGDSYPTLIDRGSGNNNGTMTNMSSSSIVDDVPLYSNKSFTFDGTDDFVSVTNSNILDGLQKATWSFWFTKSGTSAKYLSSHYNNGNQFLFLFIPSSNRIDGYINGVRAFNNNSTTISVDTWYSAVFVLDSTLSSFSDRLKLFIDGTQITNTGGAQLQQNSTLNSDSGDILIGKATTGFNWDGNIDEVSIFNTALSQSDVTSIYNSGEPNDISCLSPLSWWRMGEDATFDGTNWTLVDNGSGDNDGTSQNMGLSSISNDVPTIPFSTRSIALDGVDDYVDCENPTSLQITNTMTLSAWVKTTDTSTYEIIIGKDSISTGTRSFLLYRSGSVARFLIFNSSGTEFVEGTTTINDGNWHHIMGVNDGTDLKIYVNGTLEGTNVGGGGTFLNGISPFNIGRRATAPANRGYFTGTIDEVAVWNSDQSANASAIGSTIPTDLSSYNPLSWWRCGDGDTAPTLTDNGSGGNNGTMANFTTFSTDVPR